MLLADYDYAVILLVDYRYEKEKDRVVKLLESKGITSIYTFVDGKGSILERKYYDQISPQSPPTWKDGPYSYSHFAAMQNIIRDAQESGANNLLFVEDDLDFTGEFDGVMQQAATQIPPDWDMIYYGANHSNARTQQVGSNVLRVFGSSCTHCVGIKNTMFAPILSLPVDRTIDWNIANRLHSSHNCYAVWPSIAIQRPGYSMLWKQNVDYSHLWRNKGTPA